MRSVATRPMPRRPLQGRRAAMPHDADPAFPPLVLTFSASDPSGGAGMQADLLTLSSMGCHPLSVITALTVQDTLGIEGVLAIDADWVADQARALLEDMPVDAFKVGVLGSVARSEEHKSELQSH